LFHFRHQLGGRADFRSTEPGRKILLTQLTRAARSTAAFPFAFDPSRCDSDRFGEGATPETVYAGVLERSALVNHHLLDGGVLNNLPIDLAIETIFAMPATGPVRRFLVAVVPDPSTEEPTTSSATVATTRGVVVASLVGIPRNRSVAAFLRGIHRRNAATRAQAAARTNLWALSPYQLIDMADALWPSYCSQRRIRSLAGFMGGQGLPPDLEETIPLPWLPLVWTDPAGCWGASTVRRLAAAMFELLTQAGDAPTEEFRARTHTVRESAELMNPLQLSGQSLSRSFREAMAAGQTAMQALDTALATWPHPAELANDTTVSQRRTRLAELIDCLAHILIELAEAWPGRPSALAEMANPATPRGTRAASARRLLCAVEVIQSAFGGLEHDPQQSVTLGILTPLRHAPLDSRCRQTAAEKLAGDELGHFGAFLKRSWRANDWMWGRLDAATFLFKLLEDSDVLTPGSAHEGCFAVQKEIVREEAQKIVQGVALDRTVGARCRYGVDLLPKHYSGSKELNWPEVMSRLGLDATDPEADFLARNRVGEERVADELFTPLTTRVGTRVAATGGAVLQQADLPFQKLTARGVAPARGVAVLAHRYSRALRAPAPGGSTMAAIGLMLGAAGVGMVDLFGLDLGFSPRWHGQSWSAVCWPSPCSHR
ncbi:MAG: DUF3376 domain-containing protein, partial [Actinobacteria bacterium]|nr:DUF3376 domain-containing protein [Actinomycetota bacterium]